MQTYFEANFVCVCITIYHCVSFLPGKFSPPGRNGCLVQQSSPVLEVKFEL